MKISEGTKISELIKFNPNAIDVIASINSHFEKLRNPILRKVLASRVTIKDAAKIGGCGVDVFFSKLSPLGFEYIHPEGKTTDMGVPSDFSLPDNMHVTTLDVRTDIMSGKDPFLKITAAIDATTAGGYLLLVNSFEPVPLIKILKEKNYECHVKQERDTVCTYIKKTSDSISFNSKKATGNPNFDNKLNEYKDRLKSLDVTALEMPGPMMAILDELERLPHDFALHVQHRRVPQFLLPELKERGIDILIKEIKEGRVELLIFK